jgi:hypothetical protein
MTGVIVETIAGTPEAVLTAFTAFGLWLPDADPPQLAAPCTVSGVPGAQIGPGQIAWVTAPAYDEAGEVTNKPEADARRLYPIRVDNRGNPVDPLATLDAVIAAALPVDAGFAARLRALAAGMTLGDPEGDPEALIHPPQGQSAVSLPSLIFRLWASHGVLTTDPVLGPILTLAGVSLLVPGE